MLRNVLELVWFVTVTFASSAVLCANEATALLQTNMKRASSELAAMTEGCRHPPPRDLPPVAGPVRDVIVILGGPTHGIDPGPWLEWRLRAALKVHQKFKADTTAFLLTGGRPKSYGSCAAYSEAAVMQNWLEHAGVSKGVWREDRSNHTLDNAELSWYRLNELHNHRLLAGNVSLHIITQPWHMVKARQCFNVFFRGSRFHVDYDSPENFTDDTMALFEQESYADMYRVQLKNWLPWQLGFNWASPGASPEAVGLIDSYVTLHVADGRMNAFFVDGTSTAKGSRSTMAQPSSSWNRINELQWRKFKETLETDSVNGSFVETNKFSRWGSLDKGQQPRYVTAFNQHRDSGDFLGLQCHAACGRQYDALRVTAFLRRPHTAAAQLKALEDVEAWASSTQAFSPVAVAAFMVKHFHVKGRQEQAFDAHSQLQGWNATAFSKMLDTMGLQKLQKL